MTEELPLLGWITPLNRLGRDVWRVELDGPSPQRAVAKKLDRAVGTRVERALRQWLPAVGLQSLTPSLRQLILGRNNEHVWHLYQDLGDHAPDENDISEEAVQAAVAALASLHSRAVRHRVLPAARSLACDYRPHTLQHMIGRAMRAVATASPTPETAGEWGELRNGLVDRFATFYEEAGRDVELLSVVGGDETLLHGDAWPKNFVITGSNCEKRARLVDWDRVGVGPPVYDLSAFLSRLPHARRQSALDRYRELACPAWPAFPSVAELNMLGRMCERARLANWAFWRVSALSSTEGAWALDSLAACGEWLSPEPLVRSLDLGMACGI